MSIELSFQNGVKLRLRAHEHSDPISLTPGLGAARLQLNLEAITVAAPEGFTPITLDGDVHAVPGSTGPRWLGTFAPLTLALNPAEGFARGAELVVPIGSAQIFGLEALANGGDLALQITTQARLAEQGANYPLAHGQGQIRVPASIWQRQLAGLGLAVGFHVTVPVPMDRGPLAEAARHLHAAQQQITAGQWTDAIREDRLALEEMRNAGHWPSSTSVMKMDRDARTLTDRFAVLLQGGFDAASCPQHTGAAQAAGPFNRADAVAVHGIAVSLYYKMIDFIAV